MHSTTRSIRLSRAFLLLSTVLALLGAAPKPRTNTTVQRPTALFTAQGQVIDTVLVYGPTRCQITSGTSASAFLSFSTTPVAGRRYLLQATNGNANGTNRVTGGQLWLNGNELEGANGLSSSVPTLTRITKDVTSSNTLEVTIQGSVGAFIDVRVVHVPDDHYTIWGPQTFTKPSGSPVDQTRTFSLPGGSPAPYTMYVTNGLADGTKRTTATKVTLNRVDILNGTADLGDPVGSTARGVALQAQDTLVVRMINEKLTVNPPSQISLSFAATDTTPPTLAVTAPARESLLVVDSVLVSGSVSEPQTALTLTVAGQSVTPAQNGTFSKVIALGSDGRQGIHVVASNTAGFTVDSVRYVTRDTQPPVLVVTSPSLDVSTNTGSSATVAGTWSDASVSTVTINGVQVGNGASGSFSHSVNLAMGANTIVVRATDGLGRVSRVVRTVIRNASSEPDPLVLDPATPIDSTEVSAFSARNSFLLPKQHVQTGVIRDSLMSVIRGRVVHATASGDSLYALPNVTVSIDGHPEYGYTTTRANGDFDLAVNGGGALVLKFSKTGFIPAQRKIDLPWNDFLWLDYVAMKGRDPKATIIDPAQLTVAVATPTDDERGVRTARAIFKPGTVARAVNAPGDTTAPLSNYHVRATEHTVGATGEAAMPAELPGATAYTYCVELSVDEAPGKEVVFSKPVAFYLDNFLHFPPGSIAPVGTLEAAQGRWNAEPDGRIVKIVGVQAGEAQLDVTGDGTADSTSILNAMGIDAAERQALAGQVFAVGDTLWRCSFTHFSEADINYPFWIAAGARGHDAGSPSQKDPRANNCCPWPGSTILTQNQTLIESVPIVGTTWSLNYSSDRVSSYRVPFHLRIPLSDTLPSTLTRIRLRIDVAGRQYAYEYASHSPLSHELDNITLDWDGWDGKDAYGRDLVGTAIAHVRIGYVFPNRYALVVAPSTWTGTNFGAPLRAGQSQAFSPYEGTIWTDYWVKIGRVENTYAGLGDWSLTPHHVYDPNAPGTIYRGDGQTFTAARIAPVLKASGGANFQNVADLAVGPDGTEYVATNGSNKYIYKRTANGSWSVFAGAGESGDFWSEGIPASTAGLFSIGGVACGPDGSVYLTEWNGPFRIRKITPDGIIRTIAGSAAAAETEAEQNDDTLAVFARFLDPRAIAVTSDSSVYVVDNAYGVVRKITPDGRIRRVAGTGTRGNSSQTGIGTSIPLNINIGRMAAMADGGVTFSEFLNGRVRRLYPNGELTTLVTLSNAFGVACGVDGNIYVANRSHAFQLGSYAELVPIAGATSPGANLEHGAIALDAPFTDMRAIAVGGDALLQILDGSANGGGGAVFTVTPVFPNSRAGEIAVTAEDRSEIYVFDTNGRHLRTLDGLTGGIRESFTYTSGSSHPGLLSSIRDMNGQTTQIMRDAQTGLVTAIVAPFSRTTNLETDPAAPHRLTRVTNPNDEAIVLDYAGGAGQLMKLRDPRGFWHRFEYDAAGRLTHDFAPDSFATALGLDAAYADSAKRSVVLTSRMSRHWNYDVDYLDGGTTERRVNRGPDGLTTSEVRDAAGVTRTNSPDGSASTIETAPDQRDGMMAPFVKSFVTTRPGGPTTTIAGFRLATGFESLSDQLTVNGRTYVTSFAAQAGGGNLSLTPPSGGARQVQVTVDSLARPLTIDLPGNLATVTAAFDADGRIDSIRVGTRGWDYRYEDGTGRLTSLRDPIGRVTQFYYDAADRLTRQVLPDQSEAAYDYDPSGNLWHLTPPGRPVHEFAFRPGDLTRSYRPPTIAGQPVDSTHYEYNDDRQLTGIVRPDTQTVTLSYDSGNARLMGLSTSRGVDEIFGYDGAGRVQTIARVGADGDTLTLGYTGSLLASETWSGATGGSVGTTYDGNLWPRSQTVTVGPVSSAVTYDYDGDGLLEDVLVGGQTYDLTPDVATGLLRSTSLGAVSTAASFNAYAELDSMRATFGGASLYAAQYERDGLGRITRWAETVQGQTAAREFSYDDLGHLWQVRDAATQAQLERYHYGVNGIRDSAFVLGGVERFASYDAQDRLLSDGSVDFTYTGNGERRRRIDGVHSQTTTYDAFGNLTSVDLADGTQLSYVVDGRNRRIERKVNGVPTHRWLYRDNLSVVAELDGAGTLTKRFVYASRGHVPDLMVVKNPSGPDSTYRLVTDHLGSVRLVVNSATGTVAQRLSYDAWGNVSEDTSPGFQPFGYAGGLYDPSAGLVRFGSRDYDARTGTWLAKDPIRFADGGNLYTYAGAAPLDQYDPTGTTLCSNLSFLLQWLAGAMPRRVRYKSSSLQTREMMQSPGADFMRRAFEENGYQSIGDIEYRSDRAWWETLLDPRTANWLGTGAQVGGFTGASVRNNGNGTATYTIYNTAGMHSFFYHGVGDSPLGGGPMHNIDQRFRWTEPIGTGRP